jgi:FlaA1/EpsC-like NDP-sugar epimerase
MSFAKSDLINSLVHKLVAMNRWAKIALMLAVDCVALPFCFAIALLLRLGDFSATTSYGVAPHVMVGLVTIVVFALSGLYRAVIRYIDQYLLRSTGIGLALAIIGAYLISFFLNDQRLPRTALTIYWFIAFSYVVASRLITRALLRNRTGTPRKQKSLAIYGAGEAGAQLARAIRGSTKYRAICFFDDKVSLQNQNVAGLKVIHASRMAEVTRELGIGLIILAIPSATAARRRQIMHDAHEAGLEIKTLSSLLALGDEKISTQSIREIKIEDLLGRAPVPPRGDLFSKCVQGKNVLVTGAGGSIGSELCRQIVTVMPRHLHLLDHSEYALYTIAQELHVRFPTISIHAHLGSVCDQELVERIMREGGIDTVYHAAAYKHVPLVEANMAEGVRNNVVGAQIVVAAAEKFHVEACVLISTDKAVRPTNVMGASKRIAELIFQAAAASASKTTFCMVRFGNVLGSSGSVVPLFQQQIERGGPITITDPEIVRYFMLIPEAAQLVIQAGAMAKGGEVFVLDMGEPIKIVDLARTMIDMAGLRERNAQHPDGDIEIRHIGLRPGEKLYEELLIGDHATPSEHPCIMRTIEESLTSDVLHHLIDRLMQACHRNDPAEIKASIGGIVKEYAPQSAGRPSMPTTDAKSEAGVMTLPMNTSPMTR